VNWTALSSDVVDKLFLYYAPKILGEGAVPFAASGGAAGHHGMLLAHRIEVHQFGEDFRGGRILEGPVSVVKGHSVIHNDRVARNCHPALGGRQIGFLSFNHCPRLRAALAEPFGIIPVLRPKAFLNVVNSGNEQTHHNQYKDDQGARVHFAPRVSPVWKAALRLVDQFLIAKLSQGLLRTAEICCRRGPQDVRRRSPLTVYLCPFPVTLLRTIYALINFILARGIHVHRNR